LPAVLPAQAEAPVQSRFRVGLDLFCERAILGCVILCILWGPVAFGAVPELSFIPIQGLTVLALALWVVRIWAVKPYRMLWGPMCWGALVFLLYALVRCNIVLLEYPARMELTHVIVYASLFFVVLNNLTRRESAAIVVICLMVLALALSWHAVYQFATKATSVWGVPRKGQYLHRGTATYLNPNHLAGLLGLTLAFTISYTLMSRFNVTAKVFFVYCALSMLAGIAATVSRGGLLATGAMLLLFCLILLTQRGFWLFALAGLIGLMALGYAAVEEFPSIQKRFDEATKGGTVDDIRADYWRAAIHVFEDHPLWGAGPAHFDWEFARYRAPIAQLRPVYAHNDYLNTLADWGAAGLAVIAGACGLLFYGAWKTWPALRQVDPGNGELQKSDKSAFLIGACMGIAMILFHSFVDFNMHVPANAIIVVILMALITGYWRFATERAWKSPPVAGKIVLTMLLLASGTFLAVAGVRNGQEAFWQHRSEDEKATFADRLTGLEKAWEVEPSNYANAYNLAEYYRVSSLDGKPGYEAETKKAMTLYEKSMALNPLDAFVPLRYGMCLDWLGKTNEAGPWFDRAAKLDPINYHIIYYCGRHFVELGDYKTAEEWFDRSLSIQWNDLADFARWDMKQRLADPNGLYQKRTAK
jgi:O-antigen ligase